MKRIVTLIMAALIVAGTAQAESGKVNYNLLAEKLAEAAPKIYVYVARHESTLGDQSVDMRISTKLSLASDGNVGFADVANPANWETNYVCDAAHPVYQAIVGVNQASTAVGQEPPFDAATPGRYYVMWVSDQDIGAVGVGEQLAVLKMEAMLADEVDTAGVHWGLAKAGDKRYKALLNKHGISAEAQQ